MPIRFHLNGQRFDHETLRIMGLAYEMAFVSLQHTVRTSNPIRATIAQKIIELAKVGERDPERLCDGAMRTTQPAAPPPMLPDA